MGAERPLPHLVLAALALVAGCECGAPAGDPPPAASVRPRAKIEVTLLYTSDEHGWLLPFVEEGARWGGAAELLATWINEEGHCPGPVPSGDTPDPGPAPPGCADPGTLALSGGDNYTGPAVSSFFGGEPMAGALARMGYAASALGNHDLDFGRERFVKNMARAHLPYLAANVKVTDPKVAGDVALLPFAVFTRRGARIAVVGVATENTLTEAKASNFAGLAIGAEEPALDDAIRAAWATEPDTIVLLAHECVDKLVPMVERHPEWRLSFVGAAHCHRVVQQRVGAVPVVSPGWRLQHYVRVRLEIDPARPAKDRVVSARTDVVRTSREEGAKAPADAPLAAATATWKKKLDDALGEQLGYTVTGFTKGSPEMINWITGAWREAFKVDIGLVNKGALRQALPSGLITKASIWSIMPFDNTLVIGSLRGRDLAESMRNEEACAVGLKSSPAGLCLASGKPLDDETRYSVVTFDFLYSGGANFRLGVDDPSPDETHMDWREPVVEWTRRMRTSAADPLERHVSARGE